jgi:hypothetical protein
MRLPKLIVRVRSAGHGREANQSTPPMGCSHELQLNRPCCLGANQNRNAFCHQRGRRVSRPGPGASPTGRERACIKPSHAARFPARLLYMPAIGELPPTFTTETALSEGLSPRDLYAARDEGEVLELSRGVFRRADAAPASYPDFLAVAYRSPVGVVCLLSAAAVHDLTDEIPSAVQIAVPRASHPPRISFPPTTVLRFEQSTFDLGLTHVDAAPGEPVRIYDAVRTVIDLMRLRHRVGAPIALAALHRYLRRRDARPAELLKVAAELRVHGPVLQALDVASAQ